MFVSFFVWLVLCFCLVCVLLTFRAPLQNEVDLESGAQDLRGAAKELRLSRRKLRKLVTLYSDLRGGCGWPLLLANSNRSRGIVIVFSCTRGILGKISSLGRVVRY